MPIGVAFALVLWLGNAAYLYLSVSFIQMVKALMPMSVSLPRRQLYKLTVWAMGQNLSYIAACHFPRCSRRFSEVSVTAVKIVQFTWSGTP